MSTIQKWFSDGCNYAEGVAIYQAHPKHNKNIAKILARRENKSNLMKLKHRLKLLCDDPITTQSAPVVIVGKRNSRIVKKNRPTPPIAVDRQPEQTHHTPQKESVFFHDLPPELRPILLKANALFKELCLLKVSLNEQPENAVDECNQIQVQIHTKRKENRLLWDKIDYYLEHRELPTVNTADFKDLTPAQLWNKNQLSHQNISKNKKRLAEYEKQLKQATTTADKTKLERKIAKTSRNILKHQEIQLKIKAIINGN